MKLEGNPITRTAGIFRRFWMRFTYNKWAQHKQAEALEEQLEDIEPDEHAP